VHDMVCVSNGDGKGSARSGDVNLPSKDGSKALLLLLTEAYRGQR
jgi:hypothetical protein